MKRLVLPLLAFSLASCASFQSPIPHGARAEDLGKIGAGEGPAWKDGSLYFTDGQHINRMNCSSGGGCVPANMIDDLVNNPARFAQRIAMARTSVFRDAEHAHAANGLMFDGAGRLVACESTGRRVTRTEKDGSITVLAGTYRGKRFNSPNDLTMDAQGRIYFTDPRYGPRDDMEIRDAHGLVEGVYRIDAPGKVVRVPVPEVERPNGILVSPRNRYLYICDNNNNNHGGARRLVRFDLLANGMTKADSRKVIFDWQDGRGPDGMKMDLAGRLYVAAGINKSNEYETTRFKAGCYILSPGGRLLDFVPTAPDQACNCAFGGDDSKTLYITSGNHLWSIPVNTPGWTRPMKFHIDSSQSLADLLLKWSLPWNNPSRWE